MPYYGTIEVSQEEYDRLKRLETLVSEMEFDDKGDKEGTDNDEGGYQK